MLLVLLGVGTAVGADAAPPPDSGVDPAIVETFRLRRPRLVDPVRRRWRPRSFWARSATVVLFGLISFWALREFITLTPTRPGDHRALFWVFFLFTPLQFVLVGIGA